MRGKADEMGEESQRKWRGEGRESSQYLFSFYFCNGLRVPVLRIF